MVYNPLTFSSSVYKLTSFNLTLFNTSYADLNTLVSKLDRRVQAVKDQATGNGKLLAKPRIESTVSTSQPPLQAPRWAVSPTYIQHPVLGESSQDSGTSLPNDTPRRLSNDLRNPRQRIHVKVNAEDIADSSPISSGSDE